MRTWQRFQDSLTAEQHELIKKSCEEADRDRPDFLARQIRYEENMAAVNSETRSAFDLLMALRAQSNVSLAQLSERSGIDAERLASLERAQDAVIPIELLASVARALGAEFRISIARRVAAIPKGKAVATG